MLLCQVRGRDLVIKNPGAITARSVGMPIKFVFSDEWASLHKIVVFEGSNTHVEVELVEETCTIPWTVLSRGGSKFSVSVYGTTADGSIVIPTIWSKPILIYQGTNPDDKDKIS